MGALPFWRNCQQSELVRLNDDKIAESPHCMHELQQLRRSGEDLQGVKDGRASCDAAQSDPTVMRAMQFKRHFEF